MGPLVAPTNKRCQQVVREPGSHPTNGQSSCGDLVIRHPLASYDPTHVHHRRCTAMLIDGLVLNYVRGVRYDCKAEKMG